MSFTIADKLPFALHLIASAPSHGDRHVDPDATAHLLSRHETRALAHAEGRIYLAGHLTAWCQVDDGATIEDVSRDPLSAASTDHRVPT